MSNGNFEHRLDALGRSLASAHDGPMPPALHEALGAKAATLHARKVGLAAILLMVLILVVIVLPKRVLGKPGATACFRAAFLSSTLREVPFAERATSTPRPVVTGGAIGMGAVLA